jgi:oligoendopeptidase F
MNAPMRWDLSSYFPSFEAPERAHFEESLASDVARTLGEARALPAIGAGEDDAWEALVARWEDLVARRSHLSSYVLAQASADPDARFRLAESRLDALGATFEKLSVELRRALGAASDADVLAFLARPALEGARFPLERLRVEARTRMEPALEGLAADLGTDGIMGWGRLYDTLASGLRFTVRMPDGEVREVPMAQRRSLMADGDRRVREAAFQAGNQAWKGAEDVAAATLSHIAGTRHTLNARRGVAHFLDVALHDACVTRRTLDAMMEAVADRAELPRRGLRLKARAMGLPAVSWFDLEAPLPLPDAERVPYPRALELVRASFGRTYPALREHFDAMLERRWIESEPRDGKRPGAYCTSSDLSDEQRVFMTYQGSLGDLSTLAHEVGHAWHAERMRGTRVLARSYPMTLAETASTFAEALLSEGLLADPTLSPAQRALLLGEVVGDASSFLLDIPTRFRFEVKVYEERRHGALTAARLSELMVETQREVFGDALAVGGEDPYFWASKLHFFIPDLSFYNFPYTFGFLLSRGMYAMFRAEGPSFLPRYEAFLRESGSGMAHEVAARSIGRDLESPEFWADAIDTLRAPTDELEALLPSVLP